MKTASFIESRYSCGAHNEDLGPRLGPSGEAFTVLLAHKLRRVNERVDGYEPGGRTFESCRAHQPQLIQSLPLFSQSD